MTSPSARVMAPWSGAVIKLAMAIAVAEGSNPAWNNPGDLTGVDSGSFRTNGTANSEGVWLFDNADDGWSALFAIVDRWLRGKSVVYHLTMTLEQVGMKYSGGDPNWAKNVASSLGVPQTTTLADLATTEV
jgi:hypothetical protein